MEKLKRFISGSLATLMLVGAMMSGASAKTYDDVTSDEPYAEQIEILSDIGVILGTSENEFSPDEPVTREQMAMLLFRLMLGKGNAGKINSTAFTDLYDETYHGAISWANASGFILGTSATTFEPLSGITLQDAMTMLVRALGHDSAQMNNGYPWTYIDAGVKLGLDLGIEELSYTKELTRAEVAAVLYNALSAEYLIPRTASNGMTFYEATTIIERVFGYEIDESVIIATNKYAIEDVDPVTKDGYITVRTEDGLITVKFEELGLEGKAEDYLGQNVKLVYKIDAKTRLVSVLGCTEIGRSESAQKITVGKDNAYIEIGGVKYQVVERLSDALATNANELTVWGYDSDGELAQITSNSELSALLGAYDATLIYDKKASSVADRLIIKSYDFGKLQISGGKVNLAGNMSEADLTIVNPSQAKHNDYVLFYFNDALDTLEIGTILPVTEAGTVSRITSTTATIGGTRYNLGYEKLGISADFIRAQLNIGQKVHAVVYGDSVVAIESVGATALAPSKYLIAKSGTTPMFMDGKFGYAMEALIDGVSTTIFVTNSSVTEGDVYRYTTDSAGTFTLIPAIVSGGVVDSGDNKFVQSNDDNDEIAFIIPEANATTISKLDSYYALSKGDAEAASSTGLGESQFKFVTDKDTVIITKNGDAFNVSKGIYTSTLTIADGASVTAIFDNEVGSIETLRYLYISDGSLGSIDSGATAVKIIAIVGSELIDNKVFYTYSVLNLASGKIETMVSEDARLIAGTNYLTSIEGHISSSEASIASGVVTGYTAGTVTIGGETYTLAPDAQIIKLKSSTELEKLSLADSYMGNVEFIMQGGKIDKIIFLGKANFAAAYEGGTLTVSARDNLPAVESFSVSALSLIEEGGESEIDIEAISPEAVSGDNFTFRFDKALERGTYVITFKVNGVEFAQMFIVE